MSAKAQKEVPNRVFVGCPWKTIKPKYERATDKLARTFPISFILIGREPEQTADDLLSIIKDKLLSSSHAIFDATNGNPNVSLEFGFAEASDIPVTLYLNTHAANRKLTDSAIISDLAGKRRKQYSQEIALKALLTSFAKTHPYTIRFEKGLTNAFSKEKTGTKKRYRALALKMVHLLDWKDTIRRADLIQDLQADTNSYDRDEIEHVLDALKKQGLLTVSHGRYADVFVS